MPETIRIVIADDHTIFRSGLNMLLSAELGISVVGEAEDGYAAVQLAIEQKPDVILMDIGMPELNGIEATKKIKQEAPGTNILILTMHRSDEYFFRILEEGASGYILKGAETNELINAIHAVAKGEVYLHPKMAHRLVKEYLNRTEDPSIQGARLTQREREILVMIAEGFTNKEIAEKLVLSQSTIHSHRTNLMHKLNLTSRYQLVLYAREHGYLRDI